MQLVTRDVACSSKAMYGSHDCFHVSASPMHDNDHNSKQPYYNDDGYNYYYLTTTTYDYVGGYKSVAILVQVLQDVVRGDRHGIQFFGGCRAGLVA